MRMAKSAAGHGQLNEPAHFFQLFFGDPEERIEIVDFGGDAAIKGGGVKMSDRPDAALAGENFLPHVVGADAEGTDQSDTGDHDATAQRAKSPLVDSSERIISWPERVYRYKRRRP